jgi:hypothetical protein
MEKGATTSMKQRIKKSPNASETCEIALRTGPEKLSTVAKTDPAATLPSEIESNSKSKLIAKAEQAICTVTGTSGKALAGRILGQLQSLQIGEPVLENRLGLAIDVLAELRPTSALESLLAVQMFGTHQAAILFLRNAVAEDQSPEGRDAHLARSTKLMGLFLQQLEALQKLKGKATQQKVTVEHVHIHEGGKAIVGAVSTGNQTEEESEQ